MRSMCSVCVVCVISLGTFTKKILLVILATYEARWHIPESPHIPMSVTKLRCLSHIPTSSHIFLNTFWPDNIIFPFGINQRGPMNLRVGIIPLKTHIIYIIPNT